MRAIREETTLGVTGECAVPSDDGFPRGSLSAQGNRVSTSENSGESSILFAGSGHPRSGTTGTDGACRWTSTRAPEAASQQGSPIDLGAAARPARPPSLVGIGWWERFANQQSGQVARTVGAPACWQIPA
jgi:hypothetical protein